MNDQLLDQLLRERAAAPPRPEPKAQPSQETTPSVGALWPAGVALLIIGGLLWLAGAKYTLMGWVAGLNWFLGWLALPARIPVPVGWWVLLLVPVGLLYSVIEVKRPWRHGRTRSALYYVIWTFLVFSDVITTFLGVVNPTVGAWELSRQVAVLWPLAFVWAVTLTFLPEWMIGGARTFLRR